MFSGGYMGRVLRVNLTKREHCVEKLDESDFLKLLGGRGLAAKMYYNEIGPEVKPFDEGNKLFFMTGPLTGVPLPSTTKFQLATRSPETGQYLCSNCGGDFGPHLKRCGFDGLIIEGQAADWTYLSIKDDKVVFGDAASMVGLDSNKTLEVLREAVGEKKAGALSIGPAGEALVRIAFINVDNRAFGRGGPGAVLGSKKLKGIVVCGSGEIPVADMDRTRKIRGEAVKNLKETRANHTKFGTPQYIKIINDFGCMPTRNWQTAHFEDCDTVEAQAMIDEYFVKNYACFQCSVACGKVCVVKDGPYAGARARTEYETIGMMGPNCAITDFGAIVKANQLCDELGIDTISAGNMAGVIMELYEEGLITKEDTDGIDARFGSGEALVDIMLLIGERRGIGDLMAEGLKEVVKKHPEWARYVMMVKGLPFAAYDPRGFYGNALTNGTSSRGACHNVGGWTIRAELQSGEYDRFALKGKGALVKSVQDDRAYVDSLGVCTVVRSAIGFSGEPKGDVMEAVTGHDFTPELLEIAARIYTLERIILNREGVRRADDMMPERIFKEAIRSGPTEGRRLTEEQYALMLDEYYDVRGWDKDGVPTEKTVDSLGLMDLVGKRT